jgi:thiamine kinase-like enzyme
LQDRKLPALEKAVDSTEMCRILAASMQEPGNSKPGSIRALDYKILKYKPGKTCVIEYSLYPASDSTRPILMIGKMYRKNRGETIFANLMALWRNAGNCPLAIPGNSTFCMPRPLGYASELGMVFQEKITGVPLGKCLSAGDPESAIRGVAKNLAVLHSLPLISAEVKSLADHTRKFTQKSAAQLIEEMPEAKKKLAFLIDALCNDSLRFDAPIVPAHGDLNLSQVIVANKQACFLDFDGFSLSHAALDVANFMVILSVKHNRSGVDLADIFQSAYLEYRSIERITGLNCYLALAYLRRAFICFRLQAGPGWRDEVKSMLLESRRFIE